MSEPCCRENEHAVTLELVQYAHCHKAEAIEAAEPVGPASAVRVVGADGRAAFVEPWFGRHGHDSVRISQQG